MKDTIELIRKLYHIRSCNRSLPKDIGKERPCLNYHIHQCQAPCQGYISQEEYRKSIDEVVRFLNGHYDLVLKELEEKMMAASDSLEFEKAIEYRELLTSVQVISTPVIPAELICRRWRKIRVIWDRIDSKSNASTASACR